MGTRGIIGHVLDEHRYGLYNHNDSYPAGLGSKVLGLISNAEKVDKLKKALSHVIYNEQVEASTSDGFAEYCNSLDCGDGLLYALPENYIEFLDSEFCEYGYIINLDNEVLECYQSGKLTSVIPFTTIYEHENGQEYLIDLMENGG